MTGAAKAALAVLIGLLLWGVLRSPALADVNDPLPDAEAVEA